MHTTLRPTHNIIIMLAFRKLTLKRLLLANFDTITVSILLSLNMTDEFFEMLEKADCCRPDKYCRSASQHVVFMCLHARWMEISTNLQLVKLPDYKHHQ